MSLRYPYDLFMHPLDSLLSIPALSFLVIPAFSSYGTTINFLFFYMTWAILIRSNDPLKVELLGTLAIRLLFYVLPSLGFVLFDSGAPSFAISVKEHGEDALPMGEKQGGKKESWWKVTLVSIINVLSSVALQMGVELLFTEVFHLRSALKIAISLPMPWSIAKDLFFGLVLREAFTYVLHRYALHSDQSPLAKMHMNWQHSVLSPYSLVAHYDHPLAYLAHVFLPMYIPAVLLRMHLLSFYLYLVIVSLEETFAYSGYNVLPSGFILGGIARRQEKHIMSGGEGNYGCMGLMDFLMGTKIGDDVLDDVLNEAEKKRVGKKAKGRGEPIKSKLKKLPRSEEEEDDEDIEEKDSEEERRPKGRARSTAKKSQDDELPKRKPRNGGRNGKKTRNEDENDEAGADDQVVGGKPKRKASNTGKKVKGGSRPRRMTEDDDE